MGWDAPWHWIILAVIVIALFGYKKLPDAARAMGRSLRIFKTEIKGMSDDDKAREAHREQAGAHPVEPRQIAPAEADAAVTQPSQAPAAAPATTQAVPVTTPGMPASTPAATVKNTDLAP